MIFNPWWPYRSLKLFVSYSTFSTIQALFSTLFCHITWYGAQIQKRTPPSFFSSHFTPILKFLAKKISFDFISYFIYFYYNRARNWIMLHNLCIIMLFMLFIMLFMLLLCLLCYLCIIHWFYSLFSIFNQNFIKTNITIFCKIQLDFDQKLGLWTKIGFSTKISKHFHF